MLQQSGGPARKQSSFSRDLTDMDLSSHLGAVRSSGGLLVNFFYSKVRLKSRDAATNGKVDTRLCVSKQPKGDRSTVAVRFITEDQASNMFPEQFALFKQYEDVPTSGTPLDELPGISMSQIGLLVINGFRCVEDLIEVSEDQVAQLGLDVIRAQKTAKAWLAKSKEGAEEIRSADIEARYSMQMDSMSKQFAAMEEHNRQLQAQVSALQSIQGVAPAQTAAEPVAAVNNESDDLAFDLAEMPNPFGEGPGSATGNDDIGGDPDPLGLGA